MEMYRPLHPEQQEHASRQPSEHEEDVDFICGGIWYVAPSARKCSVESHTVLSFYPVTYTATHGIGFTQPGVEKGG